MAESITFNEDCMAVMARYPDKYFDLAVVDPPYGAGFTESGGCKGWFSKYHQDNSQTVQVERERMTPQSGGTVLDNDSTATNKVTRTGGTWAEKYGKKS